MSDTNSQRNEDFGEDFGEDGMQETPLPFFWRVIQETEPADLEQKIFDMLQAAKLSTGDEDEEEEEPEEEGEDGVQKPPKIPSFAEAIRQVHPETNTTILQWATQQGYVSIVEMLCAKAHEGNIIRDLVTIDETQKKIFERWEQERERLRILEEKARLKAENPDAEEEEEEEPEEEGEDQVDFPTKLSREFGAESEPTGEEEEPQLIPYEIKKILEIGELGVYCGAYRPVPEDQLLAEAEEDDENRPLHPYRFIREGLAQMLYVNGDIYVGEFENGDKSGLGTYLFASKVPKKVVKDEEEEEEDEKKSDEPETIAKFLGWYTGQWENGKKNGSGVFFYPDGSRYVGDFLDNKRHGKGTFTYSNGDSFVGNWKNDKKDGAGEYKFTKDKSKYTGSFKGGIFKSGQWALSNNVIYEGKYGKRGEPQGRGVITFNSIGIKQRGTFNGGHWNGNDKLISV